MKYYYEGRLMIFKFKGKLHRRIILYNSNFKGHIKITHPEMTLNKIETILKEPDYIYKSSRNSLIYYYEKQLEEVNYRVVIKKYKKHVKEIVTGYKVGNKDGYTKKHVYCVYDKNTFIEYKDIMKELEDDMDFFYNIFNVSK